MVRILVLGKGDDLDKFAAFDLIDFDETELLKLFQKRLSVLIVVAQQFALDLLRTIFQTAFAVSHHPKAGEDVARPD
ncbi:hypothetical protein A9R05_06790 [Burkholderia sp. KK1]|nr:hypothetical protein A9R05_06790 [Burkholderia sp. KK1]